ncbi:MAG: hypothetical protein ACTHN5_23295 [Phycisphaerae bacterium]
MKYSHAKIFALGFLPVLTANGASYSVTAIAGPDGTPLRHAMTTNTGEILATTADGVAVIWQNGNTQVIGSPENAVFAPLGINSSSLVVGRLYSNNANNNAAETWTSGQFSSLPPLPGDDDATPYGINDSGMIVGASQSNTATSTAVAWQNGLPSNVGAFLNGTPNFAAAINNAGQIVVRSVNSSYLVQGASVTPITGPSAATVYANAINNSGQVAGTIYTTGGQGSPFIWSDGLMSIGSPLSQNAPYDTEPTSINNNGELVGFSVAGDGTQNAFLWNGSGTPVDLNSLIDPSSGWHLVTANSINDAGDIAGQGYFNGQLIAFLLTPTASPTIFTPEPATLLLTTLSLPLLLKRRR